MPSVLKQLPPKPRAPYGHAAEINGAWRLLRAAHASVGAVLETFDLVHARVTSGRDNPQGTLSHDEQELLRAAIVFTSSGLDASMHRLVRMALPVLVVSTKVTAPRAKYQEFLSQDVGGAGRTSKGVLAAVLGPDPTTALVDAYVDAKASGSYQGTGDLIKRVRDVLGITATEITNGEVDTVSDFFTARNLIVHDMDYRDVKNASSKARHARSAQATIDECDRVFVLCAHFISATADLLR